MNSENKWIIQVVQYHAFSMLYLCTLLYEPLPWSLFKESWFLCKIIWLNLFKPQLTWDIFIGHSCYDEYLWLNLLNSRPFAWKLFFNKINFNLSKASIKTSFVVVIKLDLTPLLLASKRYLSVCLLSILKFELHTFLKTLWYLCVNKFVEPVKNLQVTKESLKEVLDNEKMHRANIRNLE